MIRGFSATRMPRACGFNLQGAFGNELTARGQRYREWDLDFMAAHGFTFARLPLDYRMWTRDLDGKRRDIDDAVITQVVEMVELGKQRGIHVCVNIHRGPGYCVFQPETEPYDLWADEEAQATFAIHWRHLARALSRYTNDECSLNLLNEPMAHPGRGFTPAAHRKVMGLAAAAIRDVTPDRLIICDGGSTATAPAPELLDLGVAQSMRGYTPYQITQYKAEWWGADFQWPEPEWPVKKASGNNQFPSPYDKARLRDELYRPWRDLAAKGVGVHCGEMGVYKYTPAPLAYAYLEDVFSILDENGWGWALWQLRGPFGILDTERAGIRTEDCDGHRLDRTLFEMLKRHMP